MTALLPPDFADLEPYADWALPTEGARYAKRLASTMDELQAFYDAAFPRLEAATAYLEQFGMDNLPDDGKRLLWLFGAPRDGVVPGRGVAPATGARQRRLGGRGRRRTGDLSPRPPPIGTCSLRIREASFRDMWHEERLLIDGELGPAEGNRTYETDDPATGKVLGTAADATVADAHRAIESARRAFDTTSWATDVELRVALPAPAARGARRQPGGPARAC